MKHGLLLNIQSVLKDHLMKDFSAPLAAQIVEHNMRKHRAGIESHQEYAALINAVVADYQAIKPVGHVNFEDLKQELYAAVRQQWD